ncbi:NAD(P)-dependent alcohol dehydrogenase [Rhodococcus opacus]|uniref:NAD(P)-dependent alcohol dehydrogenase n=1 Tax=Rhodococcus opacus TaxID=37919 RepID=UPI00223574CC|nr:NAD(P)-dependent alcohol dehydrogenase [Rhodococcus opacus]UZG60352.1 NAD(P)-dependent alcohol dehydrogenase [Rhodococcus opacus]
MIAAVIPEFGRMKVREVDDPQLSGSTDVIVKVAAAGVCRTDLETMSGGLVPAYGQPVFPYVAGHETTGWVEAVGSEVSVVAPGDPVLLHPLITCGLCDGCRAGRDMYCSNSRFPGVDATTWGGFAEYMLTGERAVVPLPADADLEELAGYSDAGLTAYHAVKRLIPYLNPNGTVAVIGVGGVGHFAVQLLREMTSCTVIALDVDSTRAQLGEQLGAHASFHGPIETMLASVLELTNGGVDAVMDCASGGSQSVTPLDFVRKGGTVSLVGGGASLNVDTLSAVVKEITIVTNLVGTYTELQELIGTQRSGIRSLHTTFPLSDTTEALHSLTTGSVVGRAVLVP